MSNGETDLRQPTLVGSLLRIDPTRAGDLEGLCAAASDPLIWEQHPARDRWKREVYEKVFEGQLASGGGVTVRELSSGEIIGASRYYGWNPAERQVSIGFTFLVRRCWGSGFNHEMKRLMLEHAFRYVDRVWFHIGVNNQRSRKAIGAIGAKFDREIMNDPAWNGVSMAYYYIDKPQHAA
jgi:RimJ/RimL family protein N-acetyltransferase